MSVILHEDYHHPGEWGLWHITETEDWLRENVNLFPAEIESLSLIKGEGRRREFLSARILLHYMSGRSVRGELYKDEAGKPHLRDAVFHVSISHTVNFAAAIAHPNRCGIDVQRIVPRILRMADKFVGPRERLQLSPAHELLQLHLIWSAKEAMYKAFGRRQLDFKDHLMVDFGPFTAETTSGSAFLSKGDIKMFFDLNFRVFDDFVLVGCVERRPDSYDIP